MKTLNTFSLGSLAVLVALAPACTVTVDDSSDTDSGASDESSTDSDTAATSEGSSAAADSGADESTDTASADASAATTSSPDTSGSDTGDTTISIDLEPDAGSGSGDAAVGATADGRNGCGDAELAGATTITDAVDQDTTWSGTIFIEGAARVTNNADLTIEPGTHIIMGPDASLEVGWNSGASTLKAAGTEDEPIVFCGEVTDTGYWGSLILGRNVISNSVMKHVRIFDGGGAGAEAALELGAQVLVDNVQVSNSETAGVAAVDFDEDSTMLSVSDSDQTVILRADGAATHFPLGGELTSNSEVLARVRFTSSDQDVVFPNLGIPYLQEAGLRINDGASAQFDAGVEYQFSADAILEIGWNSGDSSVRVNGTEEAPVVFRGEAEGVGFWGGVIIGRNVRTNSNLSYLQIKHAGGDDQFALDIDAAIKLDHVSLEDNQLGAYINEQGLNEDSTTLSITGTESYPLTIEPNAITTIPLGGDFSGNTTDQIRVRDGDHTLTGTAHDLGVPYRIDGSFETHDGSNLTIEAGTDFVMSADSSMTFGWNSGSVTIIAEGTEEAPIRFTGADEVPGSWVGLIFGRNVLSDSILRWVEVSHAGGDGSAVQLDGPVDLQSCSFADYSGFGILKNADDTTDYAATNTFTGDGVADR